MYCALLYFARPECCLVVSGLAGFQDTGLENLMGSVLCLIAKKIQPLVLTECVDLSPSRQRVFSMWHEFLRDKPHLFPIIKKYTVESTPDQLLQLILDCTVLPEVIALSQLLGSEVHDALLYLTRTLCFSIHKSRNKLLGKWNIR